MLVKFEPNRVDNMGPCIPYKNTNTPGIDCSIQRPTEYIYEYEKNSIPTLSLTIKLRQH